MLINIIAVGIGLLGNIKRNCKITSYIVRVVDQSTTPKEVHYTARVHYTATVHIRSSDPSTYVYSMPVYTGYKVKHIRGKLDNSCVILCKHCDSIKNLINVW